MSSGVAAVATIVAAVAIIALVSGGGSDSTVRTVTTTVTAAAAPPAPQPKPPVKTLPLWSPQKSKGVYGTVSVQRAGSSRERLKLVVRVLVLKGHYGVVLWSNPHHQRHLYEGYPGGENTQTLFMTRDELRGFRWLDVGQQLVKVRVARGPNGKVLGIRKRRASVKHLLRVRTSKLLAPQGSQ
jgi:hypothetical protein